MSDHKFRQFYPTPSNTPQPHVRNERGVIQGGEFLAQFDAEVDDLARHLHGSVRFSTIAEAVRNMPAAYETALGIVLTRKGFTKQFTPQEVKRNEEMAAEKARVERVQKLFKAA